MREVADAYNFKFVGIETVGRPRQLRHRRRSQAGLQPVTRKPIFCPRCDSAYGSTKTTRR